ncbi:hypothetical protein OC834_003291 [Tilletia horrida]|uniref:Uncharacterized protein n=1 Tax=Tilletia horrida TaxID=155126 RepID=A0AAN6GFV9_9BASI|nr:hypothetical protein OC834_003291 [Tilletia horrida]KAK0532893.1 hypothetical protein OC835_003186 [Tilletia horrida]KAK0534898.1 hypothetical protein OC842_002502 [Tilletia horrida]
MSDITDAPAQEGQQRAATTAAGFEHATDTSMDGTSTQAQTTPMEGLMSTPAELWQPQEASPQDRTQSGAPGTGNSAPMSTDTTPPASQPMDASQCLPADEAASASNAAGPAQDFGTVPHVQSSQATPAIAAGGTAAESLAEGAQSSSVVSSSHESLTSPTLTGTTTARSTTSPDLASSQLGRPRQHSLHQSDETHSATTPASNSDDGTVHTSETSSGKSKALAHGPAKGSALQRLPIPILERIISYVRIGLPRSSFPISIREDITPVMIQCRMTVWLMQAWGMSWLFPLRTVSSRFAQAVRKSPFWDEFIFAMTHARREVFERRHMPSYLYALKLQRDLCFACSINGNNLDHRAILNAQFATNLGRFVPVCEIHEASLVTPEDGTVLCSNCFMDDRRFLLDKLPDGRDHLHLRDDVEITYTEDDERFPQAENVCSSCRAEAFYAALASEDPHFRHWLPSVKRTHAFYCYVWQAEGTAADAAKSAIEQLWLQLVTTYPTLVKNAQLQKRRERLKNLEAERELRRNQRELLKSIVNADGMDSASDLSNDDDLKSEDSVHFDDEDQDGNIYLTTMEDRWLRDRAWHDWCRYRLDNGLWKSAHDQQDAELPSANPGIPQLPRLLLHGLATKPTEDAVEQEQVIVDAPVLPPTTLFHRACRMWDETALPEFFRLPLTNIVEMLKGREDGFELSLEMDFARLFTWLRKPQAWVQPQIFHQQQAGSGSNATALASRFLQPPCIPGSAADVGPGTVARIMEIWKRACAPLGECDCGICRRQKRKRSHDESGASDNIQANANVNVVQVPRPGAGADQILVPAVPTDDAARAAAGGGANDEAKGDAAALAQDQQQLVQQGQISPTQAQEGKMPQRDEEVDATEGPRKAARVEVASQAT